MTHHISPTVSTLMEALTNHGLTVSPRGAETTELMGVSMTWPMGVYPTRLKLPKKLAAVEGVSLVAGQFDLDLIAQVAPNVNLKLFEQSSKYSLSIARQLPKAVHLLQQEPSSRRAIVYFGRAVDVPTDRTTCLTSLQFLVRDGRLHTILNMRSWDLAWGLPIDVLAVTTLGLTVASVLNVLPGMFHAQAGSLHVYTSSAARAVSDQPKRRRLLLAPHEPWPTWAAAKAAAREKFQEAWTFVEHTDE